MFAGVMPDKPGARRVRRNAEIRAVAVLLDEIVQSKNAGAAQEGAVILIRYARVDHTI